MCFYQRQEWLQANATPRPVCPQICSLKFRGSIPYCRGADPCRLYFPSSMSPGSWLCFANGRHWWEIRGWEKTGMSFSVLDNFSSNGCIYLPDSSSHKVSLPCFLILWVNLAPEIWFDCSSLVLPASGYLWLSAIANLWTASLSPVCFSTLPSTVDPTAYIIFPLLEILKVFLFSWLIEAGKKVWISKLS